ncbi:MAG: hypothetical protein VB140_01155 [Burkholderia sp.]
MQTSRVRNSFVSPEIMSINAIAPSRSIYATTPLRVHSGYIAELPYR